MNGNASPIKLALKRNYFTEKEVLFFENGDLKVSLFNFETGVEAIRIQNDRGHIIVLPFKGQEIWEAVFDGREINMYRVGKHAPKKNGMLFLDSSYGVFFFHCGPLRMGCPAEDDDHVLHGELPYADYDEAELLIGSDEQGDYISITGSYTYNRGFGPCYESHPCATIHRGSSLVDISIRIDNMSNYPMELMYMAHVNFRPVPNGRILQCNPWTQEAMPLRDYIPSHFEIPEGYAEQTAILKKNPRLTEVIDKDVIYKPEVAFYLDAPKMDTDGWTHLMQVLPDGTADYMKYKPSELDHAMRWLVQNPDQKGLGLAFPSTANVEGYNIEKKSGHVKELPPKGSYTATVIAGGLNKEEAQKQEANIKAIMGSNL